LLLNVLKGEEAQKCNLYGWAIVIVYKVYLILKRQLFSGAFITLLNSVAYITK